MEGKGAFRPRPSTRQAGGDQTRVELRPRCCCGRPSCHVGATGPSRPVRRALIHPSSAGILQHQYTHGSAWNDARGHLDTLGYGHAVGRLSSVSSLAGCAHEQRMPGLRSSPAPASQPSSTPGSPCGGARRRTAVTGSWRGGGATQLKSGFRSGGGDGGIRYT